MIVIGAHVPNSDPLAEGSARGADLAQFFLSNPQSWKAPKPREDAAELLASKIPLYVHAPYLVNVGSPNNRVRIPSRRILADTVAGAEAIGARAVIVHGGHIGDDEGPEVAVERWQKTMASMETEMTILIENTAGGGNAIAREIDGYGPLWDGIGDLGVGACLDTCHAWAAGEEMDTVVGRLRDATGRLDLVHCNDSRDPHNSRRDRHENLGKGQIPEDLLVGVVAEADVPVVVETPPDGQADDIAWLRERLD